MGPEKGDSAGGRAGDAREPDGPPPIEFELVDNEYAPTDDAPDNAVAVADTETLRSGSSRLSRLGRTPRALRVLGALAAAAAFTVAVWPASGGSRTKPTAAPTASASPAQQPIDVDLYKVRVTGSSLSTDGLDQAVLGLRLANDAANPLNVVNAELWDATGTRLGYSEKWPAGEIDARSTASLPLDLPYSCNTLLTTPVLPVTFRYSVTSIPDPEISHNYEYPLDLPMLDSFMHARAGRCSGPDGGVFAASIETVPQIGDHHDRHGFDLVLTLDAVGPPGWTVRDATMDVADVTVSSPDLPAEITPDQSSRVRVHWTFPDCVSPPKWSNGFPVLRLTARPAGGPADGSADQPLVVLLRPELLTNMVHAACWS